MKPPIEKAGKMRVGKNYRSVYKVIAPIQCGHCSREIEPGELVTRGSTKEFAYSCLLCDDCRAVIINTTQSKTHPLTRFIVSREWFDNANGNVIELMDSITKAAGYSTLKKTWGFANMVGYHLEKRDRLLGARFFCLLNEVSDEFKIIRSETVEAFNEMFG